MNPVRHARIWLAALVVSGVSAAGSLQGIHQAPAPDPSQPVFHIGVDAVRIDAVVTDKDGRIITDLTADDFELKDDGRPQTVTLATFVPVASGPATAAAADASRPARGDAPSASPVPAAPPLPGKEMPRSIVVLVDDLGMSFESVYHARKALHTFFDESLQPTDVVAVTRTGMVAGTQRQFTTDRRLLHAAVDQLRWTVLSRRGVESFDSIEGTGMTNIGGGPGGGGTSDPAGGAKMDDLREKISALATLSAANLTVKAMASVPGRKAMILVSEGFDMYDGVQIDPRIQSALDTLWDQAARAGVVIYALATQGLQTGMLLASDNTSKLGSASAVRGASSDRHAMLRGTQDSLSLLTRETGGFAAMDTNDLAHALRRIVDDIRGFYIIGYAPNQETFERKGATIATHRIALKVKRPGLTVKFRGAFLGRSDQPPAATTPSASLVSAAMSPFTATTIPLALIPIWSGSPSGLSIKSLLQVNASALTFAPVADGGTLASAEVAAVIVSVDGTVVTSGTATFTVQGAGDPASMGVVTYTVDLRVPQPGGYQVRFALRDSRSGAIGSIGEFVEVPDVARGVLAVSTVRLGSEHAGPVDITPAAATDTADSAAPPAQRFRAGDDVPYFYEVYNADSSLTASPRVLHDGQAVLEAPPDTLQPDGSQRHRVSGAIRLNDTLPAGHYVLQVEASTPGEKGKPKVARSRVDFEVR